MLVPRRGVWHPLVIGTLAAASAWWAPSARAQTPSPKPLPCPRRWIYQPPPTTAYLRPLYVSDSAGDLFWWEYNTAAELVAVPDGETRWPRRLSSLGRGAFLPIALLVRDELEAAVDAPPPRRGAAARRGRRSSLHAVRRAK